MKNLLSPIFFRQINSLVISFVGFTKFLPKSDFHNTVHTAVWKNIKFTYSQCGNFRNFPPLQNFFVKLI